MVADLVTRWVLSAPRSRAACGWRGWLSNTPCRVAAQDAKIASSHYQSIAYLFLENSGHRRQMPHHCEALVGYESLVCGRHQ